MELREQKDELLRYDMALEVNKFMGDHIRKAVNDGLPKPDGTGFISAILALIKQEYVRLAKDQTLPDCPLDKGNKPMLAGWLTLSNLYKQAQQDMLSANWKKIEGE